LGKLNNNQIMNKAVRVKDVSDPKNNPFPISLILKFTDLLLLIKNPVTKQHIKNKIMR